MASYSESGGLEAGLDLDILILEHIFGERWVKDSAGNDVLRAPGESPEKLAPPTPRYSTDIAAAFEMEEAIAAMGLSSKYGEILRDSLNYDVTHMGSAGREIMPAHPFDIAHASPLQRCIAALKAIRQPKS